MHQDSTAHLQPSMNKLHTLCDSACHAREVIDGVPQIELQVHWAVHAPFMSIIQSTTIEHMRDTMRYEHSAAACSDHRPNVKPWHHLRHFFCCSRGTANRG